MTAKKSRPPPESSTCSGEPSRSAPPSGVAQSRPKQRDARFERRRTMSKHASSSMALLVLVGGAGARRRGRDGTGRPRGPTPLKDRAVRARVPREELACLKEAREAAAPCFEGCKRVGRRGARRPAPPIRDSDACRSARARRRARVSSPATSSSGRRRASCKRDGHDCVRACPFVGEPPCLARCRVDHVALPGRRARGVDRVPQRTATTSSRRRATRARRSGQRRVRGGDASALQACLEPCRATAEARSRRVQATPCASACRAATTDGTTIANSRRIRPADPAGSVCRPAGPGGISSAWPCADAGRAPGTIRAAALACCRATSQRNSPPPSGGCCGRWCAR